MPQIDGHFQIIERINDNAYKIDLLGEYSVNVTFNVVDLSFFDVGDDSRSNSFQKIGNDTIQATPNDQLEVPVGLVTRLRAKRYTEAFNRLFQDIWDKVDFKMVINNEDQALINLIHVQEGLVGGTKVITQGSGYKDSNRIV